jgi:hypothetical protein
VAEIFSKFNVVSISLLGICPDFIGAQETIKIVKNKADIY